MDFVQVSHVRIPRYLYFHEWKKNVHEESLPIHLTCMSMSYVNFDHLDLLFHSMYK